MAKTYRQGFFTPKNPQKYSGDVTNIVYRSSWELRAFQWADLNPSVLVWNSEETVIPYICQTDGKLHRYFVDMKLKIKSVDGTIRDYVVEIKPFSQTQPPKYPGKQTKRYLEEVETFVKNQSKWEAARNYAKERNMQFVVLTEKELFGTNGK